MSAYFIRFLKRVGILIPGLVMIYVAAHTVFPEIDKYSQTDVIALIITYIITAYILIPIVFQLIRFLIRPKHIPFYCTTPDGFASDPLNIGVIATKDELIAAMKTAGWHKADPHTPKNVAKSAVAMILQRPYPNAPFSSLRLFGRKQDVGFELPVTNSPSQRHHVRFWALTFDVKPRYEKDLLFWERHLTKLEPDRYLWLGAVSQDIGLRPIRHNAQMTHLIDPDTNAERQFLVDELRKTGLVNESRSVVLGKPYRLRNRAITGFFHADGKMTICELKEV